MKGRKVTKGWFEGGSEGVFRRLAANKVVLNYTHLHAFTRLYTKFLGVNVTDINDAEITTETPRHRGETDWPQKNTENAKRVGNGVPEYWGGTGGSVGVLESWGEGGDNGSNRANGTDDTHVGSDNPS